MNRVCSIFSQLLQLFTRVKFQQAAVPRKAERHARGFTCWGQFVAMLFCQLGQGRVSAGDLPGSDGHRREAEASGNRAGTK